MDKLNTLISTLSAQLQADFWKTMYFAQKTGKVEKTNTFIFALVELALDYYEQPVEQVAQISEKGEAAVEQPTPKKKQQNQLRNVQQRIIKLFSLYTQMA